MKVRGRPRMHRQVSDSLLNAAATQLRQKSHLELTSREIASAAGTNAAMINYYFRGKDGLLTELIDAISLDGRDRLREIEADIDQGAGDPTEHIVRALVEAAHPRAEIIAIVLIEFARPDSPIKRLYAEHVQLRGWNILARLEDIVRKLVARKVYSPTLNPPEIAWLIMSLILGPLIVRPIWEVGGGNTKCPSVEEWVQQVTISIRKTCLTDA